MQIFKIFKFSYLACSFNSFTKSTAAWLTAKSVSDELILSRVNNEGAVFHIFADAQKAQVANASFDNYLVIVLNNFSQKINIVFLFVTSFYKL